MSKHHVLVLSVCLLGLAAPAAWADLNNTPAIAHDSGTDLWTYGVPVTQTVAAGGSYAGLSSYVSALDSGGPNYLGSQAVLRDGLNTGAETVVSMAWRNRAEVESISYWHETNRPPLAIDSYNNISDVVQLTGVTGPYVMEMDYDENALVLETWIDTWRTEEQLTQIEDAYGKGRLYLAWFNPHGAGTADDQWEYATYGNSTNGSLMVQNYAGSFDAFLLDYPDFNLTDYMSSYGVDIVANRVWAVLDHNTPFGVIPEPATVGLLILGGLAMFLRRRRR